MGLKSSLLGILDHFLLRGSMRAFRECYEIYNVLVFHRLFIRWYFYVLFIHASDIQSSVRPLCCDRNLYMYLTWGMCSGGSSLGNVDNLFLGCRMGWS